VLHRLTNAIYPARFQGAGKTRSYFEGYYLKIVDAAQGLAIAFIPGVSYAADGSAHAFLQVLDGVGRSAEYHRFSIRDFAFAKTEFELQVGSNVFSSLGCEVNVDGVHAQLAFRQNHPWPHRWYGRGAMGPFAYVPAMQCRHGVVSMHHLVSGSITKQGQNYSLSPQAVGYIEKDWGKSFPRHWVWLQTNHFRGESSPSCLLVSTGRVPIAGTSFTGFITALLWRGQTFVFATYNGARMKLELRPEGVELSFRRRSVRLNISVAHSPGVDLAAPQQREGMIGRVNESLTATAKISLYQGGECLLETVADWCGFEVGGDWA